jgi:hypothetical protein
MSGAYSRNKGASAERELCKLLTDYIGGTYCRNLKQYQQAQHGDIEQLVGPYLIEAKNHAKLAVKSWWLQAVTAANVRGAVPCVAYRLANLAAEDRWRFRVPEPYPNSTRPSPATSADRPSSLPLASRG